MAGYGYFANGRVVLAMTSETSGHATVRGKRTQMVHLEAREGELTTSCTCASNALEMTGCRHVWAAVLEADRTGAFASLRESPRPLKLRARSAEPRAADEPPAVKDKPIAKKGKGEKPESADAGRTAKGKKPTKPTAKPASTTAATKTEPKPTKKQRATKR